MRVAAAHDSTKEAAVVPVALVLAGYAADADLVQGITSAGISVAVASVSTRLLRRTSGPRGTLILLPSSLNTTERQGMELPVDITDHQIAARIVTRVFSG